MIKILYFARLREQLDAESEAMEVTDDIKDLWALTERLKSRGGVWADVFGGGETVLMAVNQEIANASTPIRDGDEIAYFPPVTGG